LKLLLFDIFKPQQTPKPSKAPQGILNPLIRVFSLLPFRVFPPPTLPESQEAPLLFHPQSLHHENTRKNPISTQNQKHYQIRPGEDGGGVVERKFNALQ
jgi:hypothetical protein